MRHSMAVAVASLVWFAPLNGEEPALPVRLRLTTAPDLPAVTRAAIIEEATAIWHRAGVRLLWEDPSSAATSPGLRILVVHRPPPPPEGEWPVGELVIAHQSNAQTGPFSAPIAFVSIEAGRQIVVSAGIPAEPERMAQHRLGVVLGRAAAHEIGHFLLGTPTHAGSGLMRARIDADSFADLRDGAFFLDGYAAEWLHVASAPLDASLRMPKGFRYKTN